jgi:hypothetical protein
MIRSHGTHASAPHTQSLLTVTQKFCTRLAVFRNEFLMCARALPPSLSPLSLSLSLCLPVCLHPVLYSLFTPSHPPPFFLLSLALLRHTGCQPATRACPSIFSKHLSSITPISAARVLASASQLTDTRARCMRVRLRGNFPTGNSWPSAMAAAWPQLAAGKGARRCMHSRTEI